jgi:phenylpropionate dioxygenase-like ring-hydroxylating dioxygenase large terminal subunit
VTPTTKADVMPASTSRQFPRNDLDAGGEADLYLAMRHFWHPVMWSAELQDAPREATLLGEDRPVVEGQRPEMLPFDLSAELHIRGIDRASLEYRKWLVELTRGSLARD